jgi:hypothetical protein
MPLEVKNKRTGQVEGYAVIGNTLKCGHCDVEIRADGEWYALDDPYFCLIHPTCLTVFEYNKKARTQKSQGRQEVSEKMDYILQSVNKMISRPWFQKRGVPVEYQKALQDLLMIHQSLRMTGTIKDKDTVVETAIKNDKE